MDKKEKFFHRINDRIRAKEVRVVMDGDNNIMSIDDALRLSEEMGLDLIEISPNANPPVCKIMDYQKFIYDEKKRRREQEKRNRENRMDVKEMRFGPNTGEHDFEFKKRHVINFLQKGDKVKSYVFFRGREIKFKEQGEILLLKLAEEVEEYGIPESLPKLEGRKLIMVIKPIKKK